MTRTRNFADVIHSKLASNSDLAEAVELEEFHANLAQEIYDARIAAGLTQKQLADRIGTTQSVIARMEDADYNGHSLPMLRRIAKAVGMKFHAGFYLGSLIKDGLPVPKKVKGQKKPKSRPVRTSSA